MTRLWLDNRPEAEAVSIASVAPNGGFLTVGDCLQQCIDRVLGYFGQGRFVFFYYEPRGEEVIWNDGRGYGFGSGGWQTYFDEILPLAARYGVDLSSEDTRGEHVLVVDRELRQAYFADYASAKALVAGQAVA